MTDPKQTAEAIIERYKEELPFCEVNAKSCAIIHVNGIIEALDMPGVDFPDEITIGIPNERKLIGGTKFWKDVLNEINNL